MYNFMKKLRKHQKGFTLIELLVVVAILGVLAAVVVPNVAKFIGSGKTEAMATELHTIQLAVTAYMADNLTDELPAEITSTNSFSGTSIAPYLVTLTTEFYYSITTAGVVTQTEEQVS
ncbi:type II secretion system protein [Dehalococcoides mccartyi]|uniref:type II secretion system protein n=1 Tax=Dehalococcoides mccartyi TaxID=61435 RepID=UPI0033950CFF